MESIGFRLAVSLAGLIGFAAAVRGFLFLTRSSVKSVVADQFIQTSKPARPATLLYFWSTGCSQCRPQELEVQRAVDEARNAGRSIEVVKVNALEDEHLVRKMRVMTLPTTVLMDGEGNVSAWNPGFTLWPTLVRQISALR
jgi:thiol-disulfide isomerase/thioredoxin